MDRVPSPSQQGGVMSDHVPSYLRTSTSPALQLSPQCTAPMPGRKSHFPCFNMRDNTTFAVHHEKICQVVFAFLRAARPRAFSHRLLTTYGFPPGFEVSTPAPTGPTGPVNPRETQPAAFQLEANQPCHKRREPPQRASLRVAPPRHRVQRSRSQRHRSPGSARRSTTTRRRRLSREDSELGRLATEGSVSC